MWYIDRSNPDGLEKQYPGASGKVVCPNLLADATQLPFAPASLDFIIASHVFEHLPFPLMALRVWYEALARGGVLLLKIPDKRYTLDSRRSRTPLSHLLAEHEHLISSTGEAITLSLWRMSKLASRSNLSSAKRPQIWRQQNSTSIITPGLTPTSEKSSTIPAKVWRFDWHTRIFWDAHFYRKEAVALLVRN